MKGKKSLTKNIFTKSMTKSNKKALNTVKSYEKLRKQLDEVNKAMGRTETFQTQNNSTKNSKLDFNGIKSTNNIQINPRLA